MSATLSFIVIVRDGILKLWRCELTVTMCSPGSNPSNLY